MKKCSICKIERELSAYNKNKAQKDGLQTSCRECQKSLKSRSKVNDNTSVSRKKVVPIPIDDVRLELKELRNMIDGMLAQIAALRNEVEEIDLDKEASALEGRIVSKLRKDYDY